MLRGTGRKGATDERLADRVTKGYFGDFADYIPFTLEGPALRIASIIVGFIVGLVTAAIVSGLLATVINISKEATLIRELLTARRLTPPPP